MTIQEMVILLLTPAAEMTEADINYFVDNQPALREVQDSALYDRAGHWLSMKKEIEGIDIPTRDTVKEVVESASDYLDPQWRERA